LLQTSCRALSEPTAATSPATAPRLGGFSTRLRKDEESVAFSRQEIDLGRGHCCLTKEQFSPFQDPLGKGSEKGREKGPHTPHAGAKKTCESAQIVGVADELRQ
jgi:hypothetical protein